MTKPKNGITENGITENGITENGSKNDIFFLEMLLYIRFLTYTKTSSFETDIENDRPIKFL